MMPKSHHQLKVVMLRVSWSRGESSAINTIITCIEIKVRSVGERMELPILVRLPQQASLDHSHFLVTGVLSQRSQSH